jgi:hypothetical protein
MERRWLKPAARDSARVRWPCGAAGLVDERAKRESAVGPLHPVILPHRTRSPAQTARRARAGAPRCPSPGLAVPTGRMPKSPAMPRPPAGQQRRAPPPPRCPALCMRRRCPPPAQPRAAARRRQRHRWAGAARTAVPGYRGRRQRSRRPGCLAGRRAWALPRSRRRAPICRPQSHQPRACRPVSEACYTAPTRHRRRRRRHRCCRSLGPHSCWAAAAAGQAWASPRKRECLGT